MFHIQPAGILVRSHIKDDMLQHSDGEEKKKHSHMYALFSHLILSINTLKAKHSKIKTLSLNGTWHCDLQSKQNTFKAVTV